MKDNQIVLKPTTIASIMLDLIKMIDNFSMTVEEFSNNAIFETLALCRKQLVKLFSEEEYGKSP